MVFVYLDSDFHCQFILLSLYTHVPKKKINLSWIENVGRFRTYKIIQVSSVQHWYTGKFYKTKSFIAK